MIRLMIADDHAIVRGGLKQIFATTSDIVVVSEASESSELLEQWEITPCELLLLDMNMPGFSGVKLVQRLHEKDPFRPIVILSMHHERQLVARALKAGASGYVTKGSEPEILLAAIRKVAGGGKFIDPSLVETMIFNSGSDEENHFNILSKRELQVLKMIAAGASLSSVAEQLHLSPKTVSTHKMRLMQKLGIDNNADLIRYASKQDMF
ncbi:MAG: response regulator transcription factor [Dechloromonas sp.]|uniref:Response regulator transcription factor n=1 Tax=Candidatus Dechloromonas phosphorivorans TaxID=2899244 RepID=A0A935K2R2_9RHOO|nr:response regulator transcription factor [Candidatus Dechloromonas phosphorivorans]